MVDFPRDESLMTAGLDAWHFAKEECPADSGWGINEERLQARLGVSHFRLPPDYREPVFGEKYPREKIPFVRFPRWHYCHHCGGMELLPLFGTRQRCAGRPFDQQSCADRPEKKRPFLIPMRFVAVCNRGHIEDFPFMHWVHRDPNAPATSNCKLRARAGRSSAGLTGITIECSCGQWRTMGGVFEFDENKGGALERINHRCIGLRPWLGEFEKSASRCGGFLRVVQRGASNVYFPYVVSSIYLPLWAEDSDRDVIKALEDPTIWSILSSGLVNGKIDPSRCEIIARMRHLKSEDLLIAAQRKLDGTPIPSAVQTQTEEEYRQSEYEALASGRGGVKTDLLVEIADLAKYQSVVSRYFARICLVHKLRETRALAGFTRIFPSDGRFDNERMQPIKLDTSIDWLPAIVIRGEGIFLEMNPEAIAKWESVDPEIHERIVRLNSYYNQGRSKRGQEQRPISPKFVLLHTLAHVLINQLSFDCGYGSASLRERIYCDFIDQTHPMQGILIYTASGDSEGTMGGLVRQGKPGRFESVLLRALHKAAWCSSDPVCIESVGQGADNANLAACHGCALLPETSCEEGNRLLDRALLIGTPKNPQIGFFHELI